MKTSRGAKVTAVAAMLLLLGCAIPVGALPTIDLKQISTGFNSPIGIDHHEPTNTVIISSNYFFGEPFNFERIDAAGTHIPFSAIHGLTDEVKIATARSGNPGGWPIGTVFSGTGVGGQIIRVAPDGLSSNIITLPGEPGLMRGSLYVDRTGVFGGDLIAVTTTGGVWRIAQGAPGSEAPTQVAQVPGNPHLEGVITVPNDPAKYGPLAGKIIAGAEGQGLVHSIDVLGNVVSHALGVNPEDFDLIPDNENFYGVNFGSSRILGAPASEFDGLEGLILVTQELHGGAGLFVIQWNGVTLTAPQLTLTVDVCCIGQWEHVTFSSAGIVEIPPPPPPPGIPEPPALVLLGAGLSLLVALARGRRPRGVPFSQISPRLPGSLSFRESWRGWMAYCTGTIRCSYPESRVGKRTGAGY